MLPRTLGFRSSARLTLLLGVLVTSCGPSAKDHAALQQALARTTAERDSLKAEVDELRNGAVRRIIAVRNAFERQEFSVVQAGAEALTQQHPGSPEAIEAARLAKTAAERETAAKAKAERERRAAQEAADREARRTKEEKLRAILRVSRVWTSGPNSAGGVDYSVRWQNRSTKTVKYAYFTVLPYNAVGDIVTCSIRGNSRFRGQSTGPFRPGQWSPDYYSWENAWYNHSITRVKLVEVELEYTDGTSVHLSEDDIQHVRY